MMPATMPPVMARHTEKSRTIQANRKIFEAVEGWFCPWWTVRSPSGSDGEWI